MELKENEVIHSLDINNLQIIQNKKGFCFGMDAVLLSDFAKEIKANKNIMDLCAGNAAISLLLSAKTVNTKITAVEIQESVADLAKRSIKLNNLSDRISVLNIDLKKLNSIYPQNSFDAIVCNPPYKKLSTGLINKLDTKTIARHEISCTLDDIINISSYLLKFNGTIYIVHRPERLVDVLSTLRKYKLEPKTIRFIQPKQNEIPNLFLIKAVKGGKSFLKFLNNLIIYNEDGTYTKEFLKIYNMA